MACQSQLDKGFIARIARQSESGFYLPIKITHLSESFEHGIDVGPLGNSGYHRSVLSAIQNIAVLVQDGRCSAMELARILHGF